MSDFINPQLQKQTISSPSYKKEIVLNRNNVRLNFLLARVSQGKWKIRFIVELRLSGNQINPMKQVRASTVNMASLKKAILDNVSSYDLKYIDLDYFNTNTAEFYFDHEKWLKDATANLTPRTHMSKFDREFKLKKKLPSMITTTYTSPDLQKLIVNAFKDWLEKSKKENDFFKYLIPRTQRSKIRTKFRNMFEWEYDIQWNKIIATLKSIYIMALLYAVGEGISKLNSKNINSSKKNLFSVKVKSKIPKFDSKKWEKFIKKRFI